MSKRDTATLVELVSAAYEEAMTKHGILPQARALIRATAEAALEDVTRADTDEPPVSPEPFTPVHYYGTRPPRIERL